MKEVFNKRVCFVGKSYGFVIPKDVCDKHGLGPGSYVKVTLEDYTTPEEEAQEEKQNEV